VGISPQDPSILRAIENGLLASDLVKSLAEPKRRRAPKPELVAPAVRQFDRAAVWVIPLVTASESNGREWRQRSARTQAARKAVSVAFGPHLDALAPFANHYHAGNPICVVLTRLGGKRLDRSNLTVALKATEDAVALFLGADDGDPRWRADWEQEPGELMGVRVELRFDIAPDLPLAGIR
jgi:hypothetical protein